MRIAVSGSSGLIGSSLVSALGLAGHQVHRLIRHGSTVAPPDISWDPNTGVLPSGAEGIAAVVHLAGESITGRWTPTKKSAIATSRIQGTRNLAEALAKLDARPETLIAASAIGYYGNRGDEKLAEDSEPGEAFLSTVAKAWEAATAPARDAGIRVVNLRIGVVISEQGGALFEMLTPFRLGVGGPLGSGRQWMSWIALDDVVAAIEFALGSDVVSGPVNAVAPSAVTSREFARCLGSVLNRPAILPLPAFVIQAIFGEMGTELLLSSTRVVPAKLLSAGFEFRYPDLRSVLEAKLKNPTNKA